MRGGFGVGSFAVDFGDEDIRLRGEVVGELFPDRGEGLAVCSREVVSFALVTLILIEEGMSTHVHTTAQ